MERSLRDLAQGFQDAKTLRGASALLDVLAMRRAFFHGDRRFIDDAAIYADPGPGIAEMLKYLDAGRAVAVAYSLSESTRELQDALAQFGPTGDERVRGALRRLVIVSKDYAEDFKRPANAGPLSLPHIGSGQRLRDFTHEPSPLGIPANDSFTAFDIIVRYMAAACSDLAKVREAALTLVEAIAEVHPQLHARCEEITRDIQDGIRQLKSVQDTLEQTANIVAEVLDQTDTDGRRSALAMRASRADGEVSQLLAALAAVRSPHAWKLPEPRSTLTSIRRGPGTTVYMTFADGTSGDVDLDRVWSMYMGQGLEADEFEGIDLDPLANSVDIRWRAGERPIPLNGEDLRTLLDQPDE